MTNRISKMDELFVKILLKDFLEAKRVEAEKARRKELWCSAVVHSLAADRSHYTAINGADEVLAAYDKRFNGG